MSSFGLVEKATIKTKKALKAAVSEQGAENVQVYDTSAFGNRGTIPVSQLASADVIVGPDVETKRAWYANFRGGKIV